MSETAQNSAPDSYLPQSLGMMTRDLYRVFSQAIDSRVSRYGLAAHTCRYLALISDFGSMSPKELSAYLGVRSPTTLSALRILEEKRLIVRTRDPNDGRVSRYKLTAHGREVEALVRNCAIEVEEMVMKSLSDDQLKQFRLAIEQIQEALNAYSTIDRPAHVQPD